MMSRVTQRWQQLQADFDPSLYLKIAFVIVAYYGLHRYVMVVVPLDEASYRQPTIALEALRDLSVLAVILPSLALAFVNFLRSDRNRFYARWGWENFKAGEGINIRYFIVLLAAVLTWAFSTYEFNFYYGQAHLLDRLLLVSLLILIWMNPVFVPLFALFSVIVISQFNYPELLNYSWFDKELLFKILILFTVFIYLRLVTTFSPSLFIFLALCLIGSEYFFAGISKLQIGNRVIDWGYRNQLHNLFVSSYINGWLRFIPEATILQVAGVMKLLDIPLQLYTLIVELGAILLLFGRRLAILILIGEFLLHLGIFLSSGIFFWKWMVLDVGLIALLWKYQAETVRFLFTRRKAALSVIIIGFAYLYFSPTPAGWFDTRANNFYEFEASDVNGSVYNLSRNFWAPYDLPFVQDQFFYLSEDRVLVGTYGTQHNFGLARLTNAADSRQDIEQVWEEYGTLRYSESRAAAFDAFVIRFFRNANARMDKTVVPAFLRPPHHITTFPPENAFELQSPIERVRIRYVETFYNGDKIIVLQDKIIREIEIY